MPIHKYLKPITMFKFLMVSTVLSKKQFTYVVINKEEDFLSELMRLAFNHAKTIFFPLMNEEDVYNVGDLLDNKWKASLFAGVKGSIETLGLEIRNQCVRVYSLEHIENDIFNIMSDKGVFTSDTLKPCIMFNK